MNSKSMSEDQLNPEELIEGTVKEIKSQLKDADNPDYQKILELEKQNKDRVTLERFLENHIGSEDEEETETSETEEAQEQENTEEDEEETETSEVEKTEEAENSEEEDTESDEKEEPGDESDSEESEDEDDDSDGSSSSSNSSAGKGKEQKLNEVLDDLHEVQSVRGAAVVRRDGLLIASNFSQSFNENQVGAMTASTVGSGETASDALNMGEVNEVTIESHDGKLISTGAGDEGVLAVMTDADVNMGLIKVEMGNATEKIKRVI